jgi:hypothetical protein
LILTPSHQIRDAKLTGGSLKGAKEVESEEVVVGALKKGDKGGKGELGKGGKGELGPLSLVLADREGRLRPQGEGEVSVMYHNNRHNYTAYTY